MKSFFKNLLSSFLGALIAGIILLFIGLGIISSLIPSKEKPIVKDNSVLVIKFENEIVDRASTNPFDDFDISTMQPNKKMGLNQILNVLDHAKTNPKIEGILLHFTNFSAGAATIEEIRDELELFKSSGKFIYAYSDFYSQGSYYLASIADKVFLNPQGLVEFRGLTAEIMFYKKALEKLELEPVIIRGSNNKFKSAVEPFMYEQMSDASREMTQVYLNSIWNHILTSISKSRNISVEELNQYANLMKVKNPNACVELKLIDSLVYYDEVLDILKNKTGIKDDENLHSINFNRYKKSFKRPHNPNRIAVIYAAGTIDMGEGASDGIGSEKLSAQIRSARKNKEVKAIVVRINSPGGSALASEVIWREMELAKKEKPLIVSFGDVAASGGYYIACNADTILASPTTITGSIGVFGVLFNAKKLLNNTLGITIDTVKTNAHSDIGSFTREMTEDEYLVIQEEVDRIYLDFKQHVAKGRSLDVEYVDSIGQGRVWSGASGLNNGLVDMDGGLKKAIEIAADKAGLKNYSILELPKQEDPFKEIFKDILNNQAQIVTQEFTETYKLVLKVEEILKMKGIQARPAFDIVVKGL
ncbi:MAG: signal peptide peptidase SppA [Bacteroidales bacterium]|nr:signal peptide peptidase SppA [Bacteroidales bacterium]